MSLNFKLKKSKLKSFNLKIEIQTNEHQNLKNEFVTKMSELRSKRGELMNKLPIFG